MMVFSWSLQYLVINMTELEEYVKVLQTWREQVGNTVSNVLLRINNIRSVKGKDVEQILNALNDFHKDINKADEQIVDPKWYEPCISLKKKYKNIMETAQKEKKERPALEKKASQGQVEYPELLLAGRGPNDTAFLKSLYKSFVTNFADSAKSPELVPLIQGLVKKLKEIYEDKPDEQIRKRVNSISVRLARESSRESKQKMLKGQIPPSQVARDDEELYLDEKAKEEIKKFQREQLQANSTGFYDQMKKNINKDACEECRYCHKRKAFCEDMKQIRASDEPMTRFMRCNECGKAWRD